MGSKSITSSSYDGRYFRFTVTQSGTSTTVFWTFEVLGGSENYYSTSPINLYINGHNVYSKSATSWSTKVFPAAKGSTSGTYNVGAYGNFTISLSGRPYYNSAGTASTGTVTLDRPTYVVSYNANGGDNPPSNQTKTYGYDLTLSTIQPTRYGYTFMGWGTSSSTTTVSYNAGGTYKNNTAITLYAIWKKDITLNYNNNGGTGAPSSSTITIYNATTSHTFTISNTTPIRVGYDFLGWSLNVKATTASYQPGVEITLTDSSVLYAIWQLKTYQISYNANGGVGAPNSQTKTYGINLTLSSVEPTRSGYKFLGWSTSNTAEEPTYLSGGTFTTNVDTILYAVWEQLGIAYINVNGTYQAGKIWVNDYGTWMTGIIFVNDNGTWTQGGI